MVSIIKEDLKRLYRPARFIPYVLITMFMVGPAGTIYTAITGDISNAVVYADGPSMNEEFLELKEGETAELNVDGSTKCLTWKSTDPEVATVKQGKVLAQKAGDTIITAEVGDRVFTCKIHIKGD